MKRPQSPSRTKLPRGARAVMASRKKSKDSRDFYPTPPFATRALCDIVLPHCWGAWDRRDWAAWEPACGEGHMAEILKEYFRRVRATDVHNYGYGDAFCNFFDIDLSPVDWIITNPPYAKAEQFAHRALELAREGVALFVRTQFLETIGRYERLFEPRPPTLIAHFSERVPICKGRWDPKKGTATAYCWLVWVRGRQPMAPFWIPPGQRKTLTRPDDIARFAAWSLPQQEAAE